jgi:hypothetical protein
MRRSMSVEPTERRRTAKGTPTASMCPSCDRYRAATPVEARAEPSDGAQTLPAPAGRAADADQSGPQEHQ